MTTSIIEKLAITSVTLGAIAAGLFVWGWNDSGKEVNAGTYESLTEAWPRLSEPVQARLRDAMADGTITDREWKELVHPVMADAQMLRSTVPADHSEAALAQEQSRARAAFLVLTRVNPTPAP